MGQQVACLLGRGNDCSASPCCERVKGDGGCGGGEKMLVVMGLVKG